MERRNRYDEFAGRFDGVALEGREVLARCDCCVLCAVADYRLVIVGKSARKRVRKENAEQRPMAERRST